MSSDDFKRTRHRQRQARYAARLRECIAVYPVALGSRELDALVRLRWLPEAALGDRVQVGEAVASAFREMVRAKIS
jgi:hypothetical protein